MTINRITIVGTGLIGASAGLALRAAGFPGEIVGWDRHPAQMQLALDRGAIDVAAADPLNAAAAATWCFSAARCSPFRTGWRGSLRCYNRINW